MTRHPSRRAVLAASGAALTGALAGCSGALSGSSNSSDGGPSAKAVTSAPLPADTSTTYATMGSADATLDVTYVGNWKCPYCAKFDTGQGRGWFPSFVTDYVEPGKVQLRFRCLAYTPSGKPFLGKDSDRAARAGLALWNAEPESYWTFHHYVFANQPSEHKTWATTDKLLSLMKNAGVSSDARATVREKIKTNAYDQAVLDTTKYARKYSISGTPAMIIAGQYLNPLGEKKTRKAIENALANPNAANNSSSTSGGATNSSSSSGTTNNSSS